MTSLSFSFAKIVKKSNVRLTEVNLPRKPGRTKISSEEKLSRSGNHKVAYRFDLSFGYMQLGAATKDLVEILNRQIGKLKSEKKIRFKRADAAGVNVESADGKKSKSGEIFIEHVCSWDEVKITPETNSDSLDSVRPNQIDGIDDRSKGFGNSSWTIITHGN
ncbi:uncharacterized protein RAG0_10424 [Rhynchosporium agropyri]|uniref:Uncharacterized protein n=1 Tax=Rhynchosporium agropyri TaxID=914238 RepID=A0A1E1KZT9_9HELO|nr:uncharacterized protein RAG0_10424 [Rhynchosporium agropyri]